MAQWLRRASSSFAGALAVVVIGCEGYSTTPCEGPADATGLGTCEDGTAYRPAAISCDEMGRATAGNACISDEHCASGYCLCLPEGGFCQPTFCRSNAECQPGYACAALVEGVTMLVCQTPEDECLRNDDCGDGAWCSWDGARRYCEEPCDGDDCPVDLVPTQGEEDLSFDR